MATENPADSTVDGDDKLTDISGLGQAAERELHSLGIRRFDDLIQYTPEELARRLYEHTGSQRYSDKYIRNNDWIGQAKSRMGARNKLKASLPEATPAAAPAAQVAKTQIKGWKRHAEFTLYFETIPPEQEDQPWQTRVWHTCIRDRECDREETFEGITPEPWVRWIFQQAGLAGELDLGLLEQRAEAPAAPAPPSPAQVSILDVEIERQSAPGVGSKALATSLRFMIAGADAEALAAERTPYQILVLLVDQARQISELVASERGRLQAEQTEYAHRLGFPLPNVGRYEVQSLVLVQAPTELVASHHGPRFTVTP